MAERRFAQEPFATRRPASERRHVRLRPGLVDEEKAGRIDAMAMLQPARPPPGGDVGGLWPSIWPGAALPVAWNRRTQSIAVLMPMPKRFAAARHDTWM
jgi:hypothetical protein